MIEINGKSLGLESEKTVLTAIKIYKFELEKRKLQTQNILESRESYANKTLGIVTDEQLLINSKLKIIDSIVNLFMEE